MANQRFRTRVESLIKEALNVHAEAYDERHPGLAGLSREIAVKMLLRPLLPPDIGIATGKIIDSAGGESRQVDVILHHTGILPAAMYGQDFDLFPVEACLYAIEIKATANSQRAAEAVEVAKSIARLVPSPGFVGVADIHEGGPIINIRESAAAWYPNFSYFAFATDLAANGSQQREVDRVLTKATGY